MVTSSPAPVRALHSESLRRALERVSRTGTLLVAMDFDGTLAPEVDRPEMARALPLALESLLALDALPHTRVALVSGRALASLEHVCPLPPSVMLAGSHGVEITIDGEPCVDEPLTRNERVVLETLEALLDLIAAESPGAWVETKPFGRVLHTRLCSAEVAEAARESALDTAGSGLPGMRVRRGKNVVEFAVRQQTKGDAIAYLREAVAADAVVYAGDDVTDEDAFAAMSDSDLSIHTGEGETLAQFSVAGPPEIAQLLHALAEERAQAES